MIKGFLIDPIVSWKYDNEKLGCRILVLASDVNLKFEII